MVSREMTFITLFYLANGFFQALPTRVIVAIVLSLYISRRGYSRRSLSSSGAIAAVFVGFFTTLASYAYFSCLLTFFITSSYFTKWKTERKRKLEDNFVEGGQRTATQVFCNGGITLFLSLLYLLDIGPSERPIDFANDYNASWLTTALIGSLSCCNGDTWSSEIGMAIGPDMPRLITTLEKVPAGTNGGVSFQGLLGSAFGGMVIGLAFYGTHYIFVRPSIFVLEYPEQWPIIIIALVAGISGSLIDSLLGACFQYSGYCTEKKKVVSEPGPTVMHISGYSGLDNHMVNFWSSVLTALLMPLFSYHYWNRIALWVKS